MDITEIRIKLMSDPNERLQAFCSLTFDGSFVIRDLKIIQGTKGSFVAMPSRKLTDHCPRCSAKNHLRAQFCNECGVRLHQDRALKSDDGRAKLYADIAHPINSECRERIQEQVLIAYVSEVERSKLPVTSASKTTMAKTVSHACPMKKSPKARCRVCTEPEILFIAAIRPRTAIRRRTSPDRKINRTNSRSLSASGVTTRKSSARESFDFDGSS